MEGLAGELEVERLGPLGCAHHAVVRRFAHDQVRGPEVRLCERFGSPRTGFFSREQQQPEVRLSFLRQPLTGRHHRKHLPLRVAGTPSFDDALRECWLNVRRNSVQVRAEHDPGLAPGEEKVQGAVADLIDPQDGPVRWRKHPGKRFGEPLGHLPLLARSGIDAQEIVEETEVHGKDLP